MTDQRIRNIVIVGGGTAGWMSAAALAKVLGPGHSIRLIESEEIGTIGVGEATVPHLSLFNRMLGIDEAEFVRETMGTFKLGVQFVDWLAPGKTYVHGFGTSIGLDLGMLPFHQYWLRAFKAGKASEIGDYSLNTLAAPRGKFMVSAIDAPANTPLANIAYAYHFDAGRYARYLRGYAEKRGVRRTEGRIAQTLLRAHDGFVEAVVLESGERIDGELFIDCSGFRGLLIEQALKTGYEDWNHWLPTNRAVTVACERVGPPTPYTRATAQACGWQWRIGLQHRVGNGHVYASPYISDDEAAATLLRNLDGAPLGEPRLLRFVAGTRKKVWNRNVVAIGLASGFLEPLESTGIFLIQSAITRLLTLFPDKNFSEAVIDRYNALSRFELERIRDFLILHFHATKRADTPFWNYCRTMAIPESLQGVLALFQENGQFIRNAEELFGLVSWAEVMLGQGIMPKHYHPLVDQMAEKDLNEFIAHVQHTIAACVDAMPLHQTFIDRYCKATSI
ncbi:MAG TPA: tryptophan halogenase family protein [Rhodanobacter sp.]|nr:tryptophan halogenase family protein [Rhodanobacter sp.]